MSKADELEAQAQELLKQARKARAEESVGALSERLKRIDTKTRLPTDSAARKKIALSLVLDYFSDALCEVAEVIMAGQAQHGTTGWDRTKSTDHADCYLRHFMDRGTIDVDGVPHTAKASWRQLAMHQLEVEERKNLLPSRGTSVPDVGSYEHHAQLHAEERRREPVQLELPFTWRGAR